MGKEKKLRVLYVSFSSHTSHQINNRRWFWSIDLWVMGPARSLCTTLVTDSLYRNDSNWLWWQMCVWLKVLSLRSFLIPFLISTEAQNEQTKHTREGLHDLHYLEAIVSSPTCLVGVTVFRLLQYENSPLDATKSRTRNGSCANKLAVGSVSWFISSS